MVGGELAIRTDVVGLGLGHLAKYRLANLQCNFMEFFFDAPSARVTRAAFYGGDRGIRHYFQHFARLLPDVLHAGVAGDVI